MSDYGNNKCLGPVPHNESPAEAEATGTFLDEEPIAPEFMGMERGAEAGPRVLGKGTRLGERTEQAGAPPYQLPHNQKVNPTAHSQQVPSGRCYPCCPQALAPVIS